MRTPYWTRLALAAGLLLSALSGCHDQPDVRPAPILAAHTGQQAAVELGTARAWYEAPPAQPYQRRLCNVRWENAQQLSWGLLAPIADPRFVAEHSNLYFHRALVVSDEGGAVDGVIIEVVVRQQDLSAAALTALYERLFFNYQHHAAENIGEFDGYAAYYNRENFYLDGATYTNGAKQAGQAWLAFTPESSTEPTYDAHRGGYVTTICWLVGVQHFVYMEETWTGRTCYTYPSSGGSGASPGDTGPSSGSGGYPVGGGTTPSPVGGGGNNGSSPSPGSGGIPNDPVNDEENGGYGGYNPTVAVTNIIVDPSILNNSKANCIYSKLNNNYVFGSLLTNFRNTSNYNVKFVLGDTRPHTGTTKWNNSTKTALITIDAGTLDYQHAIWGAASFFHEAFHANLQQHAVATFGNLELTTWPKPFNDMTLQELVVSVEASAGKNTTWNDATHAFMANHVQLMADGLKEFVRDHYPLTYVQIGNSPEAYRALALMGLETSSVWKALYLADRQPYDRLISDFATVERHNCL